MGYEKQQGVLLNALVDLIQEGLSDVAADK